MFQRLIPPNRREYVTYHHKCWYPPALRSWSLVFLILLSWAFIITLQYFLLKSQTDGGVIFASDINRLPLRTSFVYLYMPTIIAVTFSIYVVWIDNDVKRFEPYRQLSKSAGVHGRDSLLLHYPFDFIPAVPVRAAKRGHYLVFWASFATVLTTFGVVPLQAGIFSTQKVTRAFTEPFIVSSKFMHSSTQESDGDSKYAHSVYGILKLNETMPGFMTDNYTLAPFDSKSEIFSESSTLTTNTTLYSMDLRCEDLKAFNTIKKDELEDYVELMTHFNDSAGCSVLIGKLNNDTIGESIDVNNVTFGSIHYMYRDFRFFFAGYQDTYGTGGTNVFGLPLNSTACNSTMLASFVRNWSNDTDAVNNITGISCRPYYYEQDVEATVDAATKAPREVVYLGEKRSLSEGLFNSSIFEETLYTGFRRSQHRGDSFVGRGMPGYLEYFAKLDRFGHYQGEGSSELPPMFAMAVATSQHPFEDFLDAQVLKDAFAFTYRILFVRAMVDILDTNFSTSTHEVSGKRSEQTEAVVLNPVFTYLVESLLAIISISAIVLLYISSIKSRSHTLAGLRDDPGSLATVMSMAADNTSLLADFEELDCCAKDYLKQQVANEVYRLESDDQQTRITKVSQPIVQHQRLLESSRMNFKAELKTVKPSRPTEFRWFTGIPFTMLFVVLAVLLAILFVKSRPHGLPLPSRNPVVLNLVVQYLPTAIATLIEPMWILINRLLCVLQPFEELRGSNASASKSISMNYTSLPPQLTILKAFRAGHLILGSVCIMALLANLLATSFAGLIFQDTISIEYPTLFTIPYEAQYKEITGFSGLTPIISYKGGSGEEQFLISDSNYTRNTTLPSWVDNAAMYRPFKTTNSTGNIVEDIYNARTKYFSAKLNCKPRELGTDYLWKMWNVNASSSDLATPGFKPHTIFEVQGSRGEFGRSLPCPSGKTSADLLTTLVGGKKTSLHVRLTCLSTVVVGWMRTTQGNCSARARSGTIPTDFEEANKNNTFLMVCQPMISIGDADVSVDSNGVLQSKATNHTPDVNQAFAKYITDGVERLIWRSNLAIFGSQHSGYHNDSFASENFHFFVNRAEGSLRLTDPTTPLPTYEDVIKPVEIAYARLFAIWLRVNSDEFLQLAKLPTMVAGTIARKEDRLFFSVPMFVISEIILCIYIVVSIVVYLRRPGRYLPRMPTSIAAVIALFASSAAVKDLQGTSGMTNKERENYLDDLDYQYGYGSYVGSDGAVHVGIEKVPYVQFMEEVTFKGSRVERDMLKSREDKEKKQEPRVRYTALERHDEEDERSVSPLSADYEQYQRTTYSYDYS
ncbi:hypothetical protein IQ07DRAFT_568465 [Pyrenochaeta sp. DS3sAY3a]|nr:hypothetical protein IQ07DRAFT_568465 [Pyrenochaeta sp. DS3sAY3a]